MAHKKRPLRTNKKGLERLETDDGMKAHADNSTYKKLAVQCL
jgi:hypothetical protein